MPTFGMGTGIFKDLGSSGVFGGRGGCEEKEGGVCLGLSQYRKNRLTAVIPTTSTPMAADCYPLDSDVPSPALGSFSASCFFSLSRASFAFLLYSASFLPAATFFGSFSFLG